MTPNTTSLFADVHRSTREIIRTTIIPTKQNKQDSNNCTHGHTAQQPSDSNDWRRVRPRWSAFLTQESWSSTVCVHLSTVGRLQGTLAWWVATKKGTTTRSTRSLYCCGSFLALIFDQPCALFSVQYFAREEQFFILLRTVEVFSILLQPEEQFSILCWFI